MYSFEVLKNGSDYTYKKLTGVYALSIGKHKSNDIVLTGSSTVILQFHAGIYRDSEGDYHLQDLGSKGGTKVNGVQRDHWKLSEGDQIDIGEFQITLKKETDQDELHEAGFILIEENNNNTTFKSCLLEEFDFEKISSSYELSQLLIDMNRHYIKTPDLKETCRWVIEKMLKFIHPERILIASYDAQHEQFLPHLIHPSNNGNFTFSTAIFDRLLENNNIIIAETLIDGSEADIRREVCVPLLLDKTLYGIVYFESRSKIEIISDPEVVFFANFGREFPLLIERDIQNQIGQQERLRLENKVRMDRSIVGISQETLDLIRTIEKYAPYDTTVLILGETGTGKDLIAELLHNNSKRARFPFLEVNCAAIPEGILESEMFGVIKSYPGFHNKERLVGKFELAKNGTLFLNEIGELPLHLQSKLLQAIEKKIISPLGAEKYIPLNIRIITATNRDLENEVRKGNFRMDLYERLSTIKIKAPTLRDRKDDIMVLAGYFLVKIRQRNARKISGFSNDCVDFLSTYDWPGNVRELYSAVERAFVNTEDSRLKPQDFDLKGNLESEPLPLCEMEKSHIIKALNYTEWNLTKTADILGIKRQTLYNKIEEYKIQGKKEKNKSRKNK